MQNQLSAMTVGLDFIYRALENDVSDEDADRSYKLSEEEVEERHREMIYRLDVYNTR